jgi:ABC-2 type transport system ATP-binding protein
VRPSEGQVRIFGKRCGRRAQCGAVAHIGVVPQEFNFNQFEKPFEILVNQAGYYGLPRAGARARREIPPAAGCGTSASGLAQPVRRHEAAADDRARAGARAALLILDEPTAGVDIEIRRSMWGFLQEINAAGTTVILTTHYLEEAESLCRNIAIIDHGVIVENTR